MPFIDMIIKKFNLITKKRIRYTNIYKTASKKRVCSQLHQGNTKLNLNNSGVDIVIKEADKDDNLPVCSFLKRVPNIEDLYGCWGSNKNWLLGDGKRFTTKKAAAFHIPVEVFKDPNHNAWNEIKALIEYSYKLLDKIIQTKNA